MNLIAFLLGPLIGSALEASWTWYQQGYLFTVKFIFVKLFTIITPRISTSGNFWALFKDLLWFAPRNTGIHNIFRMYVLFTPLLFFFLIFIIIFILFDQCCKYGIKVTHRTKQNQNAPCCLRTLCSLTDVPEIQAYAACVYPNLHDYQGFLVHITVL